MKVPSILKISNVATKVGNVMKTQRRWGRQNTCYLPVCDAKVVQPKKDSQELCNAGRFIVEQYFPYEPIMVANSIVPTQTLVQYYQGAALQGKLLYGIVETEEGVEKLGVLIAHRLSKGSYNEMIRIADRIKHKPTRNYLTLLAELEKKKDIVALYNTDRVLSVDVLTVHLDFRRRGVSRLLLQALIDEAYKDEIDVIRFISASEYGVKSAVPLRFASIYSGSPEALRDVKGEALAPNPLCLPHKDLSIMIIDLRKSRKEKPKEKPCKKKIM